MLTWVRKNSIEPNALVRHIAQESYRGMALAGFAHVTFLFARLLQNAPGDLGGVRMKHHCVGLRPALPLLKQE